MIKKLFSGIILILCLALSVLAVSHDFRDLDVEFPAGFEGDTKIITFNLENLGDQTIHNIGISHTVASGYNFILTPAAVSSLAPGAQIDINATMTIPDNEPAGINVIGALDITSDELNESFDIKENVRSRLEITRVDVVVDSKTDNDIQAGNKVDENAGPESKLKFDVRVENLFTEHNDIQIENIEITVTIKDIDDGNDLEETSKDFDLDPEEDKREIIEIDLPLEVDEGTYDVLIEAKGKDENNKKRVAKFELQIGVDKKSHEVAILRGEVTPVEARCGDSVNFLAEIVNLGASREKEAKIEIINPELGISISEEGIDLDDDPFDKDSKYTGSYTFNIPEDADEGSYNIDIKAYYKTTVLDDVRRIVLNVNCPQPTTTTTTITEPEVVIVTTTTTEPTTETTWLGLNVTGLDDYSRSEGFANLLIALIIIIVIGIIAVLIMIFQRFF
ncbi:MAG: hypothetical protein ABII01_02200 [Candidatus Woesearchaeota archaeon]